MSYEQERKERQRLAVIDAARFQGSVNQCNQPGGACTRQKPKRNRKRSHQEKGLVARFQKIEKKARFFRLWCHF